LGYAAGTMGAEDGQAKGAFYQVKRQASKSCSRTEEQPQQQHGEGLHSDRNRREAEGHGNVGANGYQGRSQDDGDYGLPGYAGHGQGAKAVLFKTDLLHLSLSLSNQAGGY
jgi:hypothetical protein